MVRKALLKAMKDALMKVKRDAMLKALMKGHGDAMLKPLMKGKKNEEITLRKMKHSRPL